MNEVEVYEIIRNYVGAVGIFLISGTINLFLLIKKDEKKQRVFSLIAFSIAIIYSALMMNFTITLLMDGNFKGDELLSNIALYGTLLLVIIDLIAIVIGVRNEISIKNGKKG
ncbi:MAG: hypothetical protein SPI59_00050 [Finegoldia sp.]|nr:hypothetical protein [Finegoldia sp.]